MSKKGLFASLIISVALTLSLGIYTLVCVFGGSNPGKPQGPVNTVVNVAFRTNDIVDELTGYASENIEFKLEEGAINPLKLNEEKGVYEALSAGKVTAVVALDKKGNTKTLNIIVYNQGDGSSQEKPYIIASAKHLDEFAKLVNTTSAEKVIPAFTKLVSDIDLKGYNWKPIGGQGNNEYTGTFDGSNYTIKNLTISVTQTNYQEFLAVSNTTENRAFLDLGLFGKINNAKILNLNMENANINVAKEIYSLILNETKPEGAEFDKIVRLTIGAVAGSAYNTDIVGAKTNSSLISRINAYSCANSSQAHGVGGVVGVAQLVRVSNYDVKTNIINNLEEIKGSNIGGVFGSSYSSYNAGYQNTYDAAHKTIINNIEVNFSSTLLYKNEALVGGLVGLANNTGITNSKVNSFKVVDNTAKKFVDYTLPKTTLVAGAVANLRSLPLSGEAKENTQVVEAFVSNMENVVVNKVDVFMLGGKVAGVIGEAGRSYSEAKGLTETMIVKDSTVSGNIIADSVGGFAWQINPGATVKYTKIFENPVVDLDIKAHISAGFAVINYGKVVGHEQTVEVPAEAEGEEPTTKIVKTQIDVNVSGMGALILNLEPKTVYSTRNTTYAVGVVGLASTKDSLVGDYESTISNLDVKIIATDSLNYSGIAFKSTLAKFENISVNADFTSYNYNEEDKNYSTTYMVAGAVCEADVATTLENITVVINANKNIADKTLKYGATFFGGLVARYTGDKAGYEGLSIKDCVVSGDVYFNYSYENLKIGENSYNVFIAGGLIGAIEAKTGSVEYVDALGIALINETCGNILNNKVENLVITADIKSEVMANEGYRARGIGALVGVINTDLSAPVLDLSTNKVANVEIVADDTAFTYAYTIEGGATVENITLGANKLNSFGASYSWNLGNTSAVKNPEELNVTYTAL